MKANQFTLDDFMSQMGKVNRLGPLSKIIAMFPGMSERCAELGVSDETFEIQMLRMRGIYDSMAAAERNNVGRIDAARLRRIAAGAGVSSGEVSQFLAQFKISRRMMEAIGRLGYR